MKILNIATLIILSILGCNEHEELAEQDFVAEKISKSATILLNGPVEGIFPLFGAFEERKWAKGWNPELVYPNEEIIEEGTSFKTSGHGHDDCELLWIVTKYEPENFIIQYLVQSENSYWTITVKCKSIADNRSSAEVRYSFVNLNKKGNQLNQIALESIYKDNLKDWESAINTYLSPNKLLN